MQPISVKIDNRTYQDAETGQNRNYYRAILSTSVNGKLKTVELKLTAEQKDLLEIMLEMGEHLETVPVRTDKDSNDNELDFLND